MTPNWCRSNVFSDKVEHYLPIVMVVLLQLWMFNGIPAGIYLLKGNNGHVRIMCEICTELAIKTLERRHWHCFGIFIFNFEEISQFNLVFSLLIWTRKSVGILCYVLNRNILRVLLHHFFRFFFLVSFR